MEQKKLTSRQIQAKATKDKIYQASIELMEHKGYSNIKIEDICRKAGVSVGSFYNYFKSKNDILVEIFNRADEYFEDVVEKNLIGSNTPERIVSFFVYYAKYNEMAGLETVKQLYGPDIKMFVTKGRYMQSVLQKIIVEGQNAGEISADMNADEINDYLFIAARGVAYNWCLNDGKFGIAESMENYFSRLVRIFKK